MLFQFKPGREIILDSFLFTNALVSAFRNEYYLQLHAINDFKAKYNNLPHTHLYMLFHPWLQYGVVTF